MRHFVPYLFDFETGPPTSCARAMPPRKRPATNTAEKEDKDEEIPPNQLALQKNSQSAESEEEEKPKKVEKPTPEETPKPEKKDKKAASQTQKRPAKKVKPVKKGKQKTKPDREALCPRFVPNPFPTLLLPKTLG